MSASTTPGFEVLKSFDFPERKRAGKTSPYAKHYPQWFSGDIIEISKAKVFPKAKPESMLSILRSALKDMHKSGDTKFNALRTAIQDDGIVIQAYLDEDKAKREAQKSKAASN